MNHEQKNETTLRNLFRQSEAKRLSRINFIKLIFVDDEMTCKVEGWKMKNLDGAIADSENIDNPDIPKMTNSMKVIRGMLLEEPELLANFILIEINNTWNFIGFINLDEDTFIDAVDNSLFEYSLLKGK